MTTVQVKRRWKFVEPKETTTRSGEIGTSRDAVNDRHTNDDDDDHEHGPHVVAEIFNRSAPKIETPIGLRAAGDVLFGYRRTDAVSKSRM